MNNNTFMFGDTYWIQLCGTAMGTSCACIYATLFYTYHEKTALLPIFHQHIILYVRFIDDIFVIWKNDCEDIFKEFKNSLPYGKLEWDTTPIDTMCNFLDLTLYIEANGHIATKTFQKC